MKLTGFQRIVASSLVIASAAATAATRPHYGGTLHMQLISGVVSLDPADSSQTYSPAARSILALLFDTLITLNDRGEAQPALALSWRADPGNRRWVVVLRPGVTFSDGALLRPEVVAASLRRSNPDWKIVPLAMAVSIQLDAASPDLPAELALTRNSIGKIENGKILGTGPFTASRWEPGKMLLVTARDDYWRGRPFLDAVEIEMGKNFRDETIAFDLGQSQWMEVPPEHAHLATDARPLLASQPLELIALLFSRDVQSPAEAKQRQALSLSIDRNLLNHVVMQEGGEPAGGLLPNWLSGYGFLFPVRSDLPRAQQLRAELPQAPLWNLGFDAKDPLMRVLAERIALNANDAGLRLQFSNQNTPDIRLVRVPLVSLDSRVALMQIAYVLGISSPTFLGSSVDDLYHAEAALLQSQRVIPLLHLRTAWAVSNTLMDCEDSRDAIWHLPDVWLAPAGQP